MSIKNLSSDNWIRIDDTLDKIIKKIKDPNLGEEDKKILLKRITKNISQEYNDLVGYGDYTWNAKVVIPKLFDEHFDNKIKPIVNNLSEGNLSIIKKFILK